MSRMVQNVLKLHAEKSVPPFVALFEAVVKKESLFMFIAHEGSS